MTKVGDYYPNTTEQTISNINAKYFLITRSGTTKGAYYFDYIKIDYATDPEMTLSIGNLTDNTFTINKDEQMAEISYSLVDASDNTTITPNSFNVTFSGDNASLFSYDDGYVIVETLPTEPGTYTATATATATATGYQDATAEFTVSITIPDDRPTLTLGSVSDINITLPATGIFTAPTVTKADGTAITEGITWSFAYDPEGIVTIADDGTITGLKAGTTTVTATANVDGYAPASTSFNVTTISLEGYLDLDFASSTGSNEKGISSYSNSWYRTETVDETNFKFNLTNFNNNNNVWDFVRFGSSTTTSSTIATGFAFEYPVTKITLALANGASSKFNVSSVELYSSDSEPTSDSKGTLIETKSNVSAGDLTFNIDPLKQQSNQYYYIVINHKTSSNGQGGQLSKVTYTYNTVTLPKMKINVTEPALDENNTYVFPTGTDNGIAETPLTYTITDADGNTIESPAVEITMPEDTDHYNPANFFSYDNDIITAHISAGNMPATYSAPIKINVTKDGYSPASLQFDVKLTTHKSDLAIVKAESFTEPTGEITDEQVVMEIPADNFDVETSYKLNEARTINGLPLPASLQTWDYAIEPAEGLSIVYDKDAQKHILTATKKGTYSVTASVNTTESNEIFNAAATTDFTVTVTDNRKEMTMPTDFTVADIEIPGNYGTFTPEVKDPSGNVISGITWSFTATPEGIVSISDSGTITGLKAGTAHVVATAYASGFKPASLEFDVTVISHFFTDCIDRDFLGINDNATNDSYATYTGISSLTGITYEANVSPRNSTVGPDGKMYYGLRARSSSNGSDRSGIVVKDNPGITIDGEARPLYFDHAVVTWGKFLENSGDIPTRTINVVYKKKNFDPDDMDSQKPFTINQMYGSKTASNFELSDMCEYIGEGVTRTKDDPAGTTGIITYDFALNDDRNYIGFRTAQNAVNIQQIEIVWTDIKPEVTPIVINEFTDAAVDHDALIAECDGTVENHKPNAYTLAADIADATNAEHLDKVDVTFQPAFTPAEWDETWNHAGYHHLFYGDPVLDTEKDGLQSDHFDFKAYVAGQYKMVFSIKDEYKKTHYLQNGDADHNVVRDFTLTPVLQDNVMKFYQNFVGNIQAAIYQDGKWSFTEYKDESGATVSSDLSHVMIHTGHGGELYYKVTYKDAPAATPARRGAAPAGYENYTRYDHNGINLSNASQLDLITNVNGAMSAPKSIIFSDTNVETGIDGIAAEKAEAEYYTIDGIRIDAPSAPGLYIVRRNGKGSVIRIRH